MLIVCRLAVLLASQHRQVAIPALTSQPKVVFIYHISMVESQLGLDKVCACNMSTHNSDQI
jgi:hypothetical protein